MEIVDAHLHLWDPSVLSYPWLEGPLLRPFHLRDLAEELSGSRVRAGSFVFVQAECAPHQSIDEVDWVSSIATVQPEIRGIVAFAPLERPRATEDHLTAFAQRPLVKGVRRLLQDQSTGFSSSPDFRISARAVARAGLVFDACVRWPQIADVSALADAVPELPIVLDHVGKPPVRSRADTTAELSSWAASLLALASRPNVVCKLSGLPAEAGRNWASRDLEPFLDAALAAFGSERLLFGGDWPVSAPYVKWIETVQHWVADRLSAAEGEAVLSKNAERVYRLPRSEATVERSLSPDIPPSTSMKVPVVEPEAGPTR
ncbi:amidohydrolase family protein [Microbacterium sp. NPDC057407]|uniref:amidohydrolase family protein n=1 Tax=Microbacterium sp. NPDC057407 TaxID=3346120 RepID=UPI00366B98FD